MEAKYTEPMGGISCPIDPVVLSCYLDGELSEAEAAAVKAHLETCDACQAEYEAMRETVALTRCLAEAEAPTSIMQNVSEFLSSEVHEAPISAETLRLRRIRNGISAAAAALVLITGVSLLWPRLSRVQESLDKVENSLPTREDASDCDSDMAGSLPISPTDKTDGDSAPGAAGDSVHVQGSASSDIFPEVVSPSPPSETEAPSEPEFDAPVEEPSEETLAPEIPSQYSHLYYYWKGRYYYWPDEYLSPSLPDDVMLDFALSVLELAPLAGDEAALDEARAYLDKYS